MSITLDRTSTTLTEHDDMSTTMRMDGRDLVVTVLDADGLTVGSRNTRTRKVQAGDAYMGKADTVDAAADLMTAPAPKKTPKTTARATARATTTPKESKTMTTKHTLASTNARIDLLAETVDGLARSLKVYLDADAPAKPAKVQKRESSEPASRAVQCKGTTAKGERCQRTGAKWCASHVAQKGQPKAERTPAPKATKGARTDLARRDFNRTVTTKARLAGGDTYKRVIAAWADVKAMHAEGLTPDQVIARFTK